jgi:hypothetical protein
VQECEKRKRKERYHKPGSKAEIDWGMIAQPFKLFTQQIEIRKRVINIKQSIYSENRGIHPENKKLLDGTTIK